MGLKASTWLAFGLAAGVAAWLATVRLHGAAPQAQRETRSQGLDPAPATAKPPEFAALLASRRAPSMGSTKPAGSVAAAGTGPSGTSSTIAEDVHLAVRVSTMNVPIEGAVVRVRLGGQDLRPVVTARTDERGLVSLERSILADQVTNRGAGVNESLVVEALADGYRVGAVTAGSLSTMTAALHEIELERGVPFDGRVLDAENSRPIVGASVIVLDWSKSFEFGPTDERGGFHVPGVMNDHEAQVTARAPGHAAGSLSVRVDSGKPQPAEAVLRLEAGGVLVGTVRSPDGAPVPGATVRVAGPSYFAAGESSSDPMSKEKRAARWYEQLRDDEARSEEAPDGTLRATTEVDGSFRVEGLRFGEEYEATATAGGQTASNVTGGLRVTADSGECRVVLTLRRSATVLVRVRVPSGFATQATPRVRVFSLPSEVMRFPTGVDPDGRFRFKNVDPGAAHVFVQADGFESAVRRLLIVDGTTAETEVVLEAGGTVEGVVLDTDGIPVSDAEVEVAPAESNQGSTDRHLTEARKSTTDTQGRFLIGSLPLGAAFLVAESGNHWETPRALATRGRVPIAVPARGVQVVLSSLGTLRLRVLTPDGRAYGGNAWVTTIEPWGQGSRGGAIVGGLVQTHGFEDGEYEVVIAPDDYGWIRRPFTIRDGRDVDLGDLTLPPGLVVSGMVEDGAGQRIPGASVTCVEYDMRSTRTDVDGRFALDRFPPEPVTLRIDAVGFCRRQIDVGGMQTSGLVVRLSRPAQVRGVMHDSTGSPKLAMVELRMPDAVQEHMHTTRLDGTHMELDFYAGSEHLRSDGAGRFDARVTPGRRIGWWRDEDGKEHKVGEWTLADGETRELEIVLPTK